MANVNIMSLATTVTPSQVGEILDKVIPAHQPVFLWGEPGIGKSDIVTQSADRAFAAQYGYSLDPNDLLDSRDFADGALRPWMRDVRLSLVSDSDLRGVPFVKDGYTYWAPPPAVIPCSGSGVVFIDEMNRASTPSVLNSAFSFVLDRRLGDAVLGKDWAVIAAGNPTGLGTMKLPDALANRFMHLYVKSDPKDWFNWAASSGINPMIIGFIQFRPEFLHQFNPDPKTRDNAFPTARAWASVSRILSMGLPENLEYISIQGTVGKGAAAEFLSFERTFNKLPSFSTIMADPHTAQVPTEISALYGVAAMLARRVDHSTVDTGLTYLLRLPQEYFVLCARYLQRRDKSILDASGVWTHWVTTDHHDNLFDVSTR